ncbi:MAG: hypothetical protein ABDH49_05610 [Candidatus Hydrothermales bacterium]
MSIFILIILLQPELSVYEYYSKRLINKKIFDKPLKFSLSFFKSIDFNLEKSTKPFRISSNSYLHKNFNSFYLNMDFFKTDRDSLISTKLLFKSSENIIFIFQNLKFNYQISSKRLHSYININFPVFYNKHKDSSSKFFYHNQSSTSFLYFKNLKTGFGLKTLNKNLITNLSPFVFLNSRIIGIDLLVSLNFFDKKILPSLKLFYFNPIIFLATGFSKGIEYFNPVEEYNNLLIHLPFSISKMEKNFASNFFSELFLNIGKIILKFGYKKFFDNTLDFPLLQNNKFLMNKIRDLNIFTFEFHLFNKTLIRYENYNDKLIFLHLIFKLNYRNLIFEPKLIYIESLSPHSAFKFKIGYILKKTFSLFVQYDHFKPKLFTLKREVKFGIQKRF